MATDTLPTPDYIYVVADQPDITRIAHGFFWYLKGPAELFAESLNKGSIGSRLDHTGIHDIKFKVYRLPVGKMEEIDE